jgi:hypothetical protein
MIFKTQIQRLSFLAVLALFERQTRQASALRSTLNRGVVFMGFQLSSFILHPSAM